MRKEDRYAIAGIVLLGVGVLCVAFVVSQIPRIIGDANRFVGEYGPWIWSAVTTIGQALYGLVTKWGWLFWVLLAIFWLSLITTKGFEAGAGILNFARNKFVSLVLALGSAVAVYGSMLNYFGLSIKEKAGPFAMVGALIPYVSTLGLIVANRFRWPYNVVAGVLAGLAGAALWAFFFIWAYAISLHVDCAAVLKLQCASKVWRAWWEKYTTATFNDVVFYMFSLLFVLLLVRIYQLWTAWLAPEADFSGRTG